MASASSHRSDPGRKPARFFSLRRVIQDMQQQRISSSRKRRSTPFDADARSSSAAGAASTDPVDWHSSRLPAVVDQSLVGTLDEASEISLANSGGARWNRRL